MIVLLLQGDASRQQLLGVCAVYTDRRCCDTWPDDRRDGSCVSSVLCAKGLGFAVVSWTWKGGSVVLLVCA